MNEGSIFDFTADMPDGRTFRFADHAGKAFLVVNTASKCGFTPQYDGLEALHGRYGARGLVVVAFPCDQFAHQEPGTDAEIGEFCKRNFGVTFPVMSKVDVNGPAAHPLFAFLRKRTPGLLGNSVRWNFTKFLVAPDGSTVRRFAPAVKPETLAGPIEAILPP